MLEATIKGHDLKFYTRPDIFSPENVDKGTLAMLSQIEFSESDKVLDLGCGYGVVGITAAKIIGTKNVFMSDSNKKAIQMAVKNAEVNGVSDISIVCSNGFENITESNFTHILSNPPYHADFSIPKHFIEKGFNRLCLGGKMYMVTKRKDWYKNRLTAIFGGVKIVEIDDYFVFMSEKKSMSYANK